MDFFSYKKNELHCESTPLATVAKEVGTPFYVYSYHAIQLQCQKLDHAFRDIDHLVCYSLKANSNLALGRIMAAEGLGADTVSAGEIYKALNAGFDPGKIVFSGVGKTEYDIRFALRDNILSINVESVEEMERINRVAGRMGKQAPVALRINPDINPRTHPHISTGLKKNKFGIDYQDAVKAFKKAMSLKNIRVRGMAYHIGSQITEVKPFVDSAKKAVQLVQKLAREGIRLSFIDIGGGLGITYHRERPPAMQELAEKLVPILQETGCTVIIEPGRSLVGNAGALVTQVQYVKKKSNKTFVVVDAGMNDLIRPGFYNAYHEVLPVRRTTRQAVKVDVVGPICESSDYFAQDRPLALPRQDEYLALMSAGAYGFAMASNYNCRLRPAEVLVRDRKSFVIRAREELTDLIDKEESWMLKLFD